MTSGNYLDLPTDLPRPVDDGACDHLVEMRLPPVVPMSTAGRLVDLGNLKAARTVIYAWRGGVWLEHPGNGLPERGSGAAGLAL